MIRGTKTDGHAYDADATIDVNAKTVTVAGSEQMTAAKGRNVYELVLTKSGKVLSTANFILDVERAAMDADTIASESVLKELNAIIAGAETATEAAANAASAADRAEDAADSVSSASAQIATNTADISDLKADNSELNAALGDITETVYGSNIFDQASATLTEGKYLNPNSGSEGTNASFCYVNDYISVKPATTYYGTVWNRNTLAFMGAFNGFTVFYTSDKSYISGLSGSSTQNPFTTPENCAYMRISMGTSTYNSAYFMFEEGSTQATQYIPYSEKSKLRLPITVVDINGNGDFTSIKDAVSTLPNGSSILVMPGTYEENVKAWSKEIHIIGFDREACVLKDVSGNYSTPPLEIGAGSVQNMTIIEQAEGAGSENLGAYAIHVESNNLFNKKLLIRNCYISSDSSSAIGMGLRGGCSVRIEDCELICAGARESTGAAPIYFHDADAQPYWGVANLYLHNNVLRNTASTLFSMLTINSIHKENTTYMHMMYNIFVRSKTPSLTQKFNTWNRSGNDDRDGWNGLSHMYLEDDSFGNNQTELNYSE